MILHLDLDTFFVSAHRTRDASLMGKPVAVGGRSNLKIFEKQKMSIKLFNDNHGAFVNPVFYNEDKNNFDSFFIDHNQNGSNKIRGIITTSSYEARKSGVKTGMSIAEALRLCPSLIVIPPDYLLYHELSYRLYLFLSENLPMIEQFSIDEFFGDVDGWIADEHVFAFATHLQRSVMDEFNLPISIGISSGKWIAKLATNLAKPNGIWLVEKHEIASFIENIPIRDFPGIGPSYAKRLEKYFIKTLGEASRHKDLFYSWHKPGRQLYHRIIGDDHESISDYSDRKSIGISRTFDPISDRDEVLRRVLILARHVVFLVLRLGVNPTTYYLKLNYDLADRAKATVTKNRLFSEPFCKNTFEKLFFDIDAHEGCVTKISIAVSNFSYQKRKTFSLIDFKDDLRANKISHSIQVLREKYSLDIIKSANEL